MGLISDIKTLLTSETNISLGSMPDTPDNCCCLYETGGYNNIYTLDKTKTEQPTIQIKVRDKSHSTCISRCESIVARLDMKTYVTIGSNLYQSIIQVGNLLQLGRDESDRTEMTLNFRIIK